MSYVCNFTSYKAGLYCIEAVLIHAAISSCSKLLRETVWKPFTTMAEKVPIGV